MKKVLFIIGSLREQSFNKQMAQHVEKMLEGKAEVEYLDYKNFPLMNQDEENPVLPIVQETRNKVAQADALWIFSPVYNFSIPGTVKNLLDYLSRSLDPSNPQGASVLQDKKVTVSSVAAGGHAQLFDIYNTLLPFIRTQVVGEFTAATINPEAWGTGVLTLGDDVIAKLEAQVSAILENN